MFLALSLQYRDSWLNRKRMQEKLDNQGSANPLLILLALALLLSVSLYLRETGRLNKELALLSGKLSDLSEELQQARALLSKTRELASEGKIVRSESVKPGSEDILPPQEEKPPVVSPEKAADPLARRNDKEIDFRINARVSAIEKFVPLTEDQRLRLLAKFRADIEAAPSKDAAALPPSSTESDIAAEPVEAVASETVASETDEVKESSPDELPATESLEDILGNENANYYKDQMRKAFEQAAEEEREKDVLLLSRRLSLAADQETALRETIVGVEREVEQAARKEGFGSSGSSMQERMRQMTFESSLRKRLLEQRLKTLLTAEQFKLYLEQQVNSSTNEFGVWHGPE